MSHIKNFFVFLAINLICSCAYNPPNTNSDDLTLESNDSVMKEEFLQTLKSHLNAVSQKDLSTLKSTMSPEGKMQLILPSTEIIYSVDSFMSYHKEWFQDTSWTFETRILNTEIGKRIGLATTEVIYREPERNGTPYFNRMIVSYGLEHLNDNWYIVKDHASSVEKSTDNK